jgi:hypothetical protein
VGLVGLLEDARGLQTLEWVALGVAILALLGAVTFLLRRTGENSVAKAIIDAISTLVKNILRIETSPTG